MFAFESTPCGYNKELSRQSPRVAQNCRPFLRVFDDVDYVTEIHNVGADPLTFGPMDRIPSVARDTPFTKALDVIPIATSIVEDTGVVRD
ncbi:MAG: hypothetical protein AABN34_21770 [Acidobacteriota bacterium]